MTRSFLAVAALAVIAGCAPTAPPAPPPPASAETALTPDQAAAALTQALGGLGFSATPTEGGLTATGPGAVTAACERIWVTDRSSDSRRQRPADPDSTTSQAVIRISPATAGSTVLWTTRHSGNYLNSFDNVRFDAICGSTGRLEQTIAAALR